MSVLCECGCGQPAPIATQTDPRVGVVKGQPRRFVKGHNNRRIKPGTDTYWAEADHGYHTPCWQWLHAIGGPDGYGVLWGGMNRSKKLAHRWAYEQAYGPVPEGLHVDHLCGNRACVNPAHLEAVTSAENTRRGRGAKLSYEAAEEIRRSPLSGIELAKRYGVGRRTISNIRTGKSWVAAERRSA